MSYTGEGILKTIAGTMAQVGSNNVYLNGPMFVVFGPEHAQTVARDGYSVADVQEYLAAGAEAVHLATAAMLDPMVAIRIRREHLRASER